VAPVLARNPPEVAVEALLRRAESTSDRELTVEEADAFAMAEVASNEVVIGVGGGGWRRLENLCATTDVDITFMIYFKFPANFGFRVKRRDRLLRVNTLPPVDDVRLYD
jgi:hypothetical protein